MLYNNLVMLYIMIYISIYQSHLLYSSIDGYLGCIYTGYYKSCCNKHRAVYIF